VRARAGHQRADRQAQLVDQVGLDQPSEQVRAAFREHPPVAAFGQRGDGGLQVDGLIAGHDDIGVRFQRGADFLWRLGSGDDDGAGIRGSGGNERTRRVQVEPRGDHRDRGSRRPAGPQAGPELLRPGRLVVLGPNGGRADHDDVGERAQQREHLPVGS
jgi:hypothetical protein